jgi:alkanesulfonate monooxygenase SsuD/methylene tetrahydromethanopterin reductase-like flavin-dependent oxidoreductase (luciferase family)
MGRLLRVGPPAARCGAPPLADPWIALTLIAQAISRIRLKPLVTPLFRRNPAKLTYETGTLDHLSKGRFVLGVGLGSDAFCQISTFGGRCTTNFGPRCWTRV